MSEAKQMRRAESVRLVFFFPTLRQSPSFLRDSLSFEPGPVRRKKYQPPTRGGWQKPEE
jgi:hypothetical protein